MGLRARDSVAPLRRSSAGWMSARIGRLYAGVGGGCEHCGTSTLLLKGPGIRWLFATLLLHHSSQSQQAPSRVQSVILTFCEVTRGIGDTWVCCPTKVCGLGAKEQGFVVVVDFQLTFSFLVVEVEDCQNCFLVLSFNFQVCKYSPTVAMSLLSTPSTVSQSPSKCMIARSLVYAYFLETVVGKSEVCCRCWRKEVPGRIPEGCHSWGVVTYSVCRWRW